MKNQRPKIQIRPLMSGLLAAVICLSSIPGAAFAADIPTAEPDAQTCITPVSPQTESTVGWTIKLSGSQVIAAGDLPVASDLNVEVYNQFNQKVDVPVSWYAKNPKILRVYNNTFAAPYETTPGKYTVVAYLDNGSDVPDTSAEYDIEVTAPRVLGAMTVPRLVRLEPGVRSLYLYQLDVMTFDQYKGTALDKAVNPKAAAASGDYICFDYTGVEDIFWTCSDQNIVIQNGYAQFPADAIGDYQFTAIAQSLNGRVITSNPMTVSIPGAPMDFDDVSPSDWFYNGVRYSTAAGLFKGISPTQFAPRLPMTRSMVVQVLYSMAGKPAVEKTHRFTDVKDSDWFSAAVAWAVQNGVSSGYPGGRFAPDDKVTREQLAVMLHGFMGKPASDEALNYVDTGSISSWAKPAMQWAVENNMMSGVPGNRILPQGLAERSQGAVIMMNFDKLPKY